MTAKQAPSTLDALFSPRRVAVLGASRNPAKLGHVLLKNVLAGGFPGEVFVVNPAGEPILGRPTVATVADLPRDLDLALVSLPVAAVLPAVEGLASLGTRVAVILTSGFGEVDARGREEQAAVLRAARDGGLRLIGPNCMGVYSRPARLNATYFWDLPQAPGGIGVISQSGAYGGLIMRHLGSLGLGVGRFLSIGNQVDLEIADALEYLATDPATTLVACFIESVRDGCRFVGAARRVTAVKPMVVLKAGKTEAGRRAAGSHTGSLAGVSEVYQAAFRRAGIVTGRETEEFFDAIQALATVSRRPRRAALAIVTVSGGPSVIAADAAEGVGVSVPAMSPETQSALRRILPAFAAVGNPVDMTPQVEPERIALAAARVLAEDSVAGGLALNVGLDIPAFAHSLIDAAQKAGKPLVACAVDAPTVAGLFQAAGVPVYPTPERAVRAYHALWVASRDQPGPAPAGHPPPALSRATHALLESGRGAIAYDAARELLAAYGLTFCRGHVADSEDAVLEGARALGYPVVIKSARPDLLHKTEAGAVVTNIQDPDRLREACRAMIERMGKHPLLIQEQVEPGTELLVGARRDETFGPLVAVGSGGFLADALRDVSMALAPVAAEEAMSLVAQGLRARLMRGYRGMPGWQPEPVAHALMALGRVLLDHPRVSEIDVNPLIVRDDRAVAVDALVIVG